MSAGGPGDQFEEDRLYRLDVDRVEAAAVDAVRRYLATDDAGHASVLVRHAMQGLSVAECGALHGVFMQLSLITQGPVR